MMVDSSIVEAVDMAVDPVEVSAEVAAITIVAENPIGTEAALVIMSKRSRRILIEDTEKAKIQFIIMINLIRRSSNLNKRIRSS